MVINLLRESGGCYLIPYNGLISALCDKTFADHIFHEQIHRFLIQMHHCAITYEVSDSDIIDSGANANVYKVNPNLVLKKFKYEDLTGIIRELSYLHILRNCPEICGVEALYLDSFNFVRGYYMERFSRSLHGCCIDAEGIYYILNFITKALKYMHKLRMYHLDIKPANILLKNDSLKLCDLGCAVLISENSTDIAGYRSRIGTPEYCPPEFLHISNTKSMHRMYRKYDSWSLGITILDLISGKNIMYEKREDFWDMSVIFHKCLNIEKHIIKHHQDNDNLLHILRNLLLFNPERRWNIDELSEFLIST